MKEIFKTKTFWGAVALAFSGVAQILAGNAQEGIQTIITAITIIFLRHSIVKIEK